MAAEAQAAGDQQSIARLCTISEYTAAVAWSSDHGDTDDEWSIGDSGVASGEGYTQGIGELCQTFVEALSEFRGSASGQSERDDGGDRSSGHGGDVAEIDSQGLAADLFGGRLVQVEMDAFDQHVDGDELFVGFGPVDDGCIVADPDFEPVMRGGALPDPVDQGELTPRAIRGGVVWLIGHGLVPAIVFAWDATGARSYRSAGGRFDRQVSEESFTTSEHVELDRVELAQLGMIEHPSDVVEVDGFPFVQPDEHITVTDSV